MGIACGCALGRSLGGVYTDSQKTNGSGLSGIRMIAEHPDKAGRFVIIGTDEGALFWTLTARFSDRAAGVLQVDFSFKGGAPDVNATLNDSGIVWPDGNIWAKSTSMPSKANSKSLDYDIGGLYKDPNHFDEAA